MKSFVVACENRPGEIAKVAKAVADRGINITTVSSVCFDDRGAVGVVTEDEAGTRLALEEAGLGFHEFETVDLPLENKPGMLADACRSLADSGVNVEFLAPTTVGPGVARASVAFGVEDAEAAHKALGA